MADTPVSVCMPVRNGMPYLRESVASVLAQTHDGLHLSISLDPCTDGSDAYVRALDDPRVTVTENSSPGLFQNLNNAIVHARHEDLHIFAQDDVMRPGFLASQMRARQAFPQAALIIAQSLERGRETDGPFALTPEDTLWRLAHYASISENISNVTTTRAIFERCGRFDESFRFAGDVDFYMKACRLGALVYNPTPEIMIRSHEGQASRSLAATPGYLREEARILPRWKEMLRPEHYRAVLRFRAMIRGSLHLKATIKATRRRSPRSSLALLRDAARAYPLPHMRSERSQTCAGSSQISAHPTSTPTRDVSGATRHACP